MKWLKPTSGLRKDSSYNSLLIINLVNKKMLKL